MGKNKPKKLKNRIITSYVTSTVSITLVLFLVGLLFLILLNAGRLTEYVREKIGFTLVLRDELSETEIKGLESSLRIKPFVKSIRFVDKETAAKELQQELGENFSGFIGFNPLSSSFEIKLYAPWTQADSLTVLENRLMEIPQVKEVFYQHSLVSIINENVKKISIFLLIFSGLLFFVFSVLINNTIRISIYSQRFIIHNMLLVGATRRFVRRPFIRKSIALGIWGAVLSSLCIGLLLMAYKRELSVIITEKDLLVLGLVFMLVLCMGIILSLLSTYTAVNRFLKMKFDELFY
jgi:cell division transport system permease protein